jgi:hypothetical protein
LGCSSKPADRWNRAAVQGKVTLDGTPLASGEITFIPLAGGTMAGAKIINGTYQLSRSEGPMIGKNRVEIRSVQPTGRIIENPVIPEGDGPIGDARVMEYKEFVPKKYNSLSELAVDIKEGQINQADFPLSGTDEK